MYDRPRSASPDLAQSCEGLIYCLSPGLYYNLGQFIPLYGASKLKSHAVVGMTKYILVNLVQISVIGEIQSSEETC